MQHREVIVGLTARVADEQPAAPMPGLCRARVLLDKSFPTETRAHGAHYSSLLVTLEYLKDHTRVPGQSFVSRVGTEEVPVREDGILQTCERGAQNG